MPLEPLEPLELEAPVKEDEDHFFRRLGELCFTAEAGTISGTGSGSRPGPETRWVASAGSKGVLVLADSWGAPFACFGELSCRLRGDVVWLAGVYFARTARLLEALQKGEEGK